MTRPIPDATHDPALKCWVLSAAGHMEFPIQNLPLGVFSPSDERKRCGIAIGDMILDLRALHAARVLPTKAQDACGLCLGETLNPLLAAGAAPRRALRHAVSAFLSERSRDDLLHDSQKCTLHLPATIGDYTDFYAGIHHATRIGRMFRPDNPLLPNYKHVPIGYHGRASSVRPSGVPVTRPFGQMKAAGAEAPVYAPSRRLDHEVELGIWIAGGNSLGEPVPIGQAVDHVAGLCLLNDWSARDMQAWEYQPLGPFLAKSFHTTISPWIVTAEALIPFRVPQPERPAGDPRPLVYLWDEDDQAYGAFSLKLEVSLVTEAMRGTREQPFRLSHAWATSLYWTIAQLLTHHASNGCDLRSGDLLGTGTISGESESECGSLMEITKGGAQPIHLPNGESRTFLEDGDEIIVTGKAWAENFIPIGLGTCLARITPARLPAQLQGSSDPSGITPHRT